MGTAKGSSPIYSLDWVPRSHLKKVIICLAMLITLLGFTVNFEVLYYTERNRLDLPVTDLQMITVRSPSSLEATSHKYGMYMYLGCTVSPFASVFWHVTQAVKVCDLSSSGQCDVKLKKDYTYDELGFKATEWLQSERFSQMLNESEVIVKLDDDTIIPKNILDDMVDQFVKSDCKFAGAMRVRDYDGLYWSSGPLILVKADHFKQQLRDNGEELLKFGKHEDVQMSAMLDLRDPKLVCNIDVDQFKHRYYRDNRMTIRFEPYTKC
ncbi:hypothetical protein BGZ98_009094 [Dissophora globulifera]|nr:hypothetical protein BGZ98_009094 [Dissophora globulifera]